VTPRDSAIAGWFERHRSFLWGLSYRITGSAEDADDVVQDTFVRACKHAPDHLDDPRRWLMRIAVNLGRDVLRRRKRRAYVGPWLPTPIETDDDESPPSFEPVFDGQSLEGRYDLVESASLAFLQALEALTPTQRAVLLLRDAFDYSAAEVAAVIDTTEGNVRIIHHRARRAMAAYERKRTTPTSASRARTNDVLRRFVDLLTAGDVRAIEQMLAADVKAVTDGGGEFTASRVPIVGAANVARFFSRLAASRTGAAHVSIRSINGQAGAVFDFPQARGRRAPRLLLTVDLDGTGSIANVWVIASSMKLAGLRERNQRPV
jgi:RNA polymerase sigma factor (sigma-70 family)